LVLSSISIEKIYTSSINTSSIFTDIGYPIVSSVIKGINGTIFAYGQTASGKTFTIRGNDEFPGFIPLAIKRIFKEMKENKELKFSLSVSFMEIYNESINDLLTDGKEKLEIKEGGLVKGLTSIEVGTISDAIKLLKEGDTRKKVAETKANSQSSRSHTIFRIRVESTPIDPFSSESATISYLSLIDLAGSESVSRTKAEGARLREGSSTNKSLLALSNLIQKLSNGSTKQISARDSKLTRLLQSDLSGNARILVICTINSTNYTETLSTLLFGVKARKIKNNAKVNAVTTDVNAKYQMALQEIQMQKEEISLLREDNKQVRLMMMKSIVTENNEEVIRVEEEIRKENVKLRSELEEKVNHIMKVESQIMELSMTLIEKENEIKLLREELFNSKKSISVNRKMNRDTSLFDTLSVIKENSRSTLNSQSVRRLRTPLETPSRHITFNDEIMNSYNFKSDLNKMRNDEMYELRKQLEEQIKENEAVKQYNESLIQKYEKEIMMLAKDLERVTIECKESTETIKKVISEKMQAIIKCESFQRKYESLSRELETLLEKKQSNKLDEQKINIEELNDCKRILAQTRREVLDKETIINSLVEDGKRIKKRCDELVNEKNALELRVHNLSMHKCPKVETVQVELEEKNRIIKNLKAEQYNLLDAKKELRNELENLKQKLKDTENQLEQVNGRNNALIIKLKALESKSQYNVETVEVCKSQNAKRKIFTAFGVHNDSKPKRKKSSIADFTNLSFIISSKKESLIKP